MSGNEQHESSQKQRGGVTRPDAGLTPTSRNVVRLLAILGEPGESEQNRDAAAVAIGRMLPSIDEMELPRLEERLRSIRSVSPSHRVWTAVTRFLNRIEVWRRTGRELGQSYVPELTSDQRESLEQQLTRCLGHPFRVLQELSTGGTGRIFEAQRISDNKRMAVKLLSDPFRGKPKMRKRFRREAEALGRLDHPNVVRVIEHGTDQGQLYIAMEYISGGSLDRRIGHGGPTVPRIGSILLQVCDALQAVHAAGVVHRDLRPGNVLLVGPDRIKLTDFGLDLVPGSSRLAEPAQEFGSALYVAPEQRRSSGEVDHRADLWSVGVMAYELFSAGDFPEVDYRPVSELNRLVPAAVDEIIRGCLKVDPDERWDSAGVLRAALEQALPTAADEVRPGSL